MHLGQSVVALYGPWKFHIGDSPLDARTGKPQWAETDFDDSSWQALDLTPAEGSFDPQGGFSGYVKGWTTRGYPGVTGYGWYRIRVRLEAHTGEKLALAGPPDVDDAYEAFANGRVLGSFGDFSTRPPRVFYTEPKMFDLPPAGADAEAGQTMVLAFRVWMEPSTLLTTPDGGGFHSAPFIGDRQTVDAVNQLRWLELIRAYVPRPVLAALYLVVAVIAFSLILFDRSDKVYLWMGAVFLGTGITNLITGAGALTTFLSTATVSIFVEVFSNPLTFAGWVMVFWVWFKLRRPAWVPRAVAGLMLLLMVSSLLRQDFFLAELPPAVATANQWVSLGTRLAFLVMLAGISILAIRRKQLDGWLVLPDVVFIGLTEFYRDLSVVHVRLTWFPFGIQITVSDVANVLLILTLSALLLRRLLISIREQRRLALDVKQAQEVQQVILPQSRLAVAGMVVESEYRPDREVGGDFFQIIPNAADGSLLIVAGDVAGKGLKAGMLVALLVGAIRSTIESETDPEVILGALNRRLLGRGDAHATCLVLRIEPDGEVKVANAGHIPPYVNRSDLDLDGSLPLGLTEHAMFSSARIRLEPGDRLIVMSDGVAEATDAAGQLFGFDRVLQLLRGAVTATEIADAAQRFGQQDDISVISVLRESGAGVPDHTLEAVAL